MSAIYPKAREAFLTKLIDWLNDDIKVSGLDNTYVYDEADEFYTDLTGVVFDSGNLTGKDATGGVADADDVSKAGVTGNDIAQLVIWQDTGTPATSRTIVHFDRTTTALIIDVTPDGGAVNIVWPNGSTKIFRL